MIFLFFLVFPPSAPAAAEVEYEVKVTLADEKRVKGIVELADFPMTVPGGEIFIPVSRIRSIRFEGDKASVEMGDTRMEGATSLEAIKVWDDAERRVKIIPCREIKAVEFHGRNERIRPSPFLVAEKAEKEDAVLDVAALAAKWDECRRIANEALRDLDAFRVLGDVTRKKNAEEKFNDAAKKYERLRAGMEATWKRFSDDERIRILETTAADVQKKSLLGRMEFAVWFEEAQVYVFGGLMEPDTNPDSDKGNERVEKGNEILNEIRNKLYGVAHPIRDGYGRRLAIDPRKTSAEFFPPSLFLAKALVMRHRGLAENADMQFEGARRAMSSQPTPRQTSRQIFLWQAEHLFSVSETQHARIPETDACLADLIRTAGDSEGEGMRKRAEWMKRRLSLLKDGKDPAIAGRPPADAVGVVRLLEEDFPGLNSNCLKPVMQILREKSGGTLGGHAAVLRALRWLAAHQEPDGSWNCARFGGGKRRQEVSDGFDEAVTGLAILAFLGTGFTEDRGTHATAVRKAVQWLEQKQRPDGSWAGNNYTNAVCAYAIVETYGMTGKHKEAAQHAIDFLATQQTKAGGWDYGKPGSRSDTAITGWAMMAGHDADVVMLEKKPAFLEGVRRHFDRAVSDRAVLPPRVFYSIGGAATEPDPNPGTGDSQIPIGILSRLLRRQPADDPWLTSASDVVMARGFLAGNFHDIHFGTLAMYHMGGEHWEKWNRAMRRVLVESQAKDGSDDDGSWNPATDRYGPEGGRVYTTALGVICLEVYYRLRSSPPVTSAGPDVRR